ncbi:MAG TPA: hypothetical protein VEA80_13155 [Vitreimonas sp.]|uniref:hypothetical protein n=1 Tax=Vitreimonas sp. TaxID=3069702 RepID=UPI002D2D5871|nr:hypothetical protein [Vitreimonas sp.]HYD88417.1 hypothetical protein [Vitreimonas sp.]
MDRKAITKAESRLVTAREAANALASCKNHEEFGRRWYVFLVSAKNVYTTLEKGSRENAKSRQWWFSEKKAERFDDPLLQYLFQARDDDEHGLEPVTEFVPESVGLGAAGPGLSRAIRFQSNGDGVFRVTSLDGLPVGVRHEKAHIKLSPVTARGGIVYTPPTMHKGQRIADPSPAGCAALALAYLSELIEEARKRAM